MSRPRCPECHRLTIPPSINGTLPSLDAVKPLLVTLLRYAQEFDDMTPSGERYGAVDFCDYLALQVVGKGYVKPAGNPNQVGSKRPKRKAA